MVAGVINAELITPQAYAARLAAYISDPKTIRVRTLEYYGRAPSVEQCAKLRAKAEYERLYGVEARRFRAPDPKASFACGHYQDEANTYLTEKGREICAACYRAAQRAAAKQLAAAKRPAAAMFPAWYRPPVDAKPKAEPVNLVRPRLHTDTLQAVADAMNISVGELIGTDRNRIFVDARAIATRIFHNDSGLSYGQIKRILHRDCHSTIRNLHLTWETRVKRNPELVFAYQLAVNSSLKPQTERV